MSLEVSNNVLVASSVFIAVVSLIGVVWVFAGVGKRPEDEDADPIKVGNGTPNPSSSNAKRNARDRVKDYRDEANDELNERIVQAGLYKRGSVAIYSTIRIGLMIVPIVMGVMVGQVGIVSPILGLSYGVVAGVLGTIIPSFWLDYRKSQRQTQIRRALPDALDVIVTCVDAGLSLPAAIARVSRELRGAHPMLAVEMAICQREIQLGATSGAALLKFSQRFDLEELRSLASVIQQAEKYGASITNAMRVHAEVLREKRFRWAEEQAQKASVKIVFPTMLCIFPALFIVLAGPAMIRITGMFEVMGL